jgi:Sigma-70, region 4
MEVRLSARVPRITGYVAKSVRPYEVVDGRSPLGHIESSTWIVVKDLERGFELDGEGYQSFDPDRIETMMSDPVTFRDSIEARGLREATRRLLQAYNTSPSNARFNSRVEKCLDLNGLGIRPSSNPKLTLKPTPDHRLLFYELIASLEVNEILASTPRGKALRRHLRRAYLGLPRQDRRIVGLRAIKQMRWESIAKDTGLPLSTVWSKYDRALKRLECALRAWSPDGLDGSPPRP